MFACKNTLDALHDTIVPKGGLCKHTPGLNDAAARIIPNVVYERSIHNSCKRSSLYSWVLIVHAHYLIYTWNRCKDSSNLLEMTAIK